MLVSINIDNWKKERRHWTGVLTTLASAVDDISKRLDNLEANLQANAESKGSPVK